MCAGLHVELQTQPALQTLYVSENVFLKGFGEIHILIDMGTCIRSEAESISIYL